MPESITFITWYSATSRGFYDSRLFEVNNVPQPFVVVAPDDYQALMLAQSQGKIIQPGENNYPVVVDPPPPTPAQVATAAGYALLAEGVAVTSVAYPALDGTYSVDQNSLINITGTVSYIGLRGNFPGNTGELTWYDSAGQGHVFTNVPEFEAFATAVCNYVSQIQQYMGSGGTVGSLPANNEITIT